MLAAAAGTCVCHCFEEGSHRPIKLCRYTRHQLFDENIPSYKYVWREDKREGSVNAIIRALSRGWGEAEALTHNGALLLILHFFVFDVFSLGTFS